MILNNKPVTRSPLPATHTKMVIAIDGPAGSGKSTIAKLLAEKKGYLYINSGKLYRAITYGWLNNAQCAMHNAQLLDNTDKIVEFAKNAQIDYRCENGQDRVFLNGVDVTDKLHTDEIDKYAAPLSAIVPVRHIVNDLIRKLAQNRDIVVEGRDMTTVVFPDAPYRFYLDASVDSRAKRRFEQGTSKMSLEEIKAAIIARDEVDKNKEEGSLKIANGVHYLDTSDLTIFQVYDKLIERID